MEGDNFQHIEQSQVGTSHGAAELLGKVVVLRAMLFAADPGQAGSGCGTA